MSCVKSMWFLLVVTLLCPVHSTRKKICDYEDVACMTEGAARVFKSLMRGIDGLFGPTSTIIKEKMKGEIKPDLKYTLFNVTMTNIENCEVKELRVDSEALTYQYRVFCPQLFIFYDYKVNGTLDDVCMDGSGHIELTLENYLMKVNGKYKNIICKKDNKVRSVLTSDTLIKDPNVKVRREITNLIPGGNKEESDQSKPDVTKKLEQLETCLRFPLLKYFVGNFLDRLKLVFKTFPAEDIWYKC